MIIHGYMGKNNICGERIRKLRKEKTLNQKQFAAQVESRYQVHLSQYTMCKIENGTRFVPDYELAAISKILDVPMEELIEPLGIE